MIPDTYMEEYTTAGFQLMEDARKAKTLQITIPFSDDAFDALYKVRCGGFRFW